MKNFPAILLLISCIAWFLFPVDPVFSQQNPFLSTDTPVSENPDASSTFFNSRLMRSIRDQQKNIQSKLSGFISDYKSKGSTKTLLTFLMFSYLYGLLHVLGPGHRKIFLFTYFVSRPSRWKQGMLAGIMTAILHAISAVVFIGGLYFITSKALLSRFNNITPILERISYAAIILIGVYLLLSHILAAVKHRRHKHSSRNPDTLLFILASGLIPCPGAATIMIFSLAVQEPLIGIYAVLAMSLGMASVLALVPPSAILIQSRLKPLLSKWNPKTGEKIHTGISITAAASLIIFGLFFII